MCGIAGIFPLAENWPAGKIYLARMLKRIRHRGPDQANLLWRSWGGMGTVRLCILDAPGGRQPFGSPSGQEWLCLNGEVYNYLELRNQLMGQGWNFQTSSDTEVALALLHQGGRDALGKIDGMFGMAYYQEETRRLLLARDRFGEKPLFIFRTRKYLAFASEIKSFLELPEFSPRPDPKSLLTIFGHWTPLRAQTAFVGVEQLGPGEYLEVVSGKEKRGTFYRPPLGERPEKNLSFQEVKKQVRLTLEKSLTLRLRSDRKVGIYLSGGLDSSILALLAKKQRPDHLSSFSVSFRDPDFDEGPFQKAVSRKLGISHHTLKVAGRDIAEHLPSALWHAEIPVFRTAFVPLYLLAREVSERGVRVVITGEGSDELFLGYDIFKEARILESWRYLSEENRRIMVGRLYPYQAKLGALGRQVLGSFFFQNAKQTGRFEASHLQRFQNLRSAVALLKKGPADRAWGQWIRSTSRRFRKISIVRRAQWIEMETLLTGYLLSTQGDRMAMSFGVENRCPFLSPELVALAMRIPENYLLKDGWNEKFILKDAFAGEIPAIILRRRKRPYVAPEAEAILQAKPDYLDSIYSESELGKTGLWEKGNLKLFLKTIQPGPQASLTPRQSQAFLLALTASLLFSRFQQEKSNPVSVRLHRHRDAVSGLWGLR